MVAEGNYLRGNLYSRGALLGGREHHLQGEGGGLVTREGGEP